MAADLFVRILFQSNEFDRSINNSRAKAKQFQSDLEKSAGGFQRFGSLANSAAGLVGKLAGGLGIAMGAFEVFDKAINSNAQLQGKWQTMMGTGKTVTDQFFSSLYSGDWTVFNEGIEKAIDNAEAYITAYRNTMKMLQSTATSYERIDAQKNQLESIVEDDTRSLDERRKAQAELDKILLMGVADIREASTILNNTLNQMIQTNAGSNRYINADNAQSTILELYNPYSSIRKELEEYRKVRDMSADTFANSFRAGDLTYYYQRQDAKAEYSQYTEAQKQRNDELLRLVDSMNEEVFNSFKELFDQINDLNDKAGTWEKDRFGARDEILSAQEELDKAASEAINKAAKDKENIIPEGSILELQKKISDLTTSFQKAADDGTRAGLQKAISEAQTQLEMMQLRANNTTLSVPGIGKTTGRNPTEDIKSGYISVKPIEAETIQANYDYADSLNAIGSMMSSVSNITNEGAAGWLRYASSLVGSISSAIPALRQLYTANQAVAIAEGTKSAASTPVIGWITAIGAIGSMIAAFATIPKFANGGIIPGNMFSGDRVPVLANSGEMILNRTQQGYLFNMLQSRGYRKNDEISTVRFEIGYDKLIGVLNNGNRKARRTT